MSEKVVSPLAYFIVYAALLVLTALTVGAAMLPVDILLHTIIGLSIASIKAMLVVLIFMHIWYSKPLTWIVASASLLWLAILLIMTLNDYLTRAWSSTLAQ